VSARAARQVEPLHDNGLVAYDRSYLAGFVVEHYQVVLLDAAKASEEAMTDEGPGCSRPRRSPATPTAT
jgi:hypothetical protein